MTRLLTNADKDSIVKKLTGGWGRVIDDAVDLFDRQNFVAGDEVRSPIATAVRSITRFNCRRWARADKSNFSTSANLANANICGLYLDGLGENPSEGEIAPPFTGGQCAGIPYGARYSWRSSPGGSAINYTPAFGQFFLGNKTLYGPISVIGIVPVGDGLFCGIPGQGSYRANGFDIDGNPIVVALNLGGSPCRPLAAIIVEGLGFERLTAGSECGNPESDITTPPAITGAPALPPGIEINLPGFGPVDVSVTLNPDGTFKVCVEQLQTCFDIDLGAGTDAPTGGADREPGDIGEPGESEDTGAGGEDEGEAGEGEVLTGLRLQIIDSPPTAKLFTGDVFRGVGYAYMGVPGNLALHFGAATMTNDQFIFAEKDNLTAWLFRANPGYNIRVTPYYSET